MTTHVVFKQRLQTLLLAAVAALLATGCKTYKEQNQVIKYWQTGRLTNAVVEANKMAAKNANNKDTVIWRLEQGAVLRGAGQYEASNQAFDQAQDKIDDYEQKAKVRLGQETGALFSNQAELDYEGRTYDGVMLNTYKALNYLALGEPDKARVELIRAYQRQQDAVELNKKRIAAVQEEAAKDKHQATMTKAENDPGFQSQMQGAYTNLDNLNKTYANYVNPFTVYLDGLFFMTGAVDGSDLERARKSFERVVDFDPDNAYVRQDLAMINALIQGKPLPSTTYVIFETGCAPLRDQVRISIPIIVTKVSYIGAAFPTLKPQGNFLPSLTVTACGPGAIITTASTTTTTTTGTTNVTETRAIAAAGGSSVTTTTKTTGDTNTTVTTTATVTTPGGLPATTSPVANMDSVIGLDFKNEMPVVITKTIASAVVKGLAAYTANSAANQQSGWLGAIMQVSTAVYQAAVNIADERTWTTLPKEFQACHFPTPPDRKIELETPDGRVKIPVTIEDGTVNLVYVKSITATGPLLVTQMKLK